MNLRQINNHSINHLIREQSNQIEGNTQSALGKSNPVEPPTLLNSQKRKDISKEKEELKRSKKEQGDSSVFEITNLFYKSREERVVPNLSTIQKKLETERKWTNEILEIESNHSYFEEHFSLEALKMFLEKNSKEKELQMSCRKYSHILGSLDFAISYSSCKGKRLTMEDTHVVTPLSFNQEQGLLCSIFDGHGGAIVAQHAELQFASFIKTSLEKFNQGDATIEGIWNGLKLGFVNFNRWILKYLKETKEMNNCGSTGTTLFFHNSHIWGCNLGDSAAVRYELLASQAQATILGREQKPIEDRMKKSIEKREGIVVRERLMGMLACARAFGNAFFYNSDGASSLTARPKIVCEENKGISIIATDGLWDVFSKKEIGEAIFRMSKLGFKDEQMTKYLIGAALKVGSEDNISVMMITVAKKNI